MKRFLYGILILCLMLLSGMEAACAEMRVGINAPRGEFIALKQWEAFGNYLSRETGKPVKIVPFAVAGLLRGVRNGDVDFILANPIQTIIMAETDDIIPLATLKKSGGPQFAGVIIARRGSGIESSEDLKGKKVISLGPVSAGAYLFQAYHLHRKGINPSRDFSVLSEGKKQDDLVLAVKAGLFDAAFVRTGILEAMAKEGTIRLDDVVIVEQRTDPGFDLIHTTRLYPEWFLSATSEVDPALISSVKNAALALKKDTPAAKNAKISGFVDALSLADLREMMQAMKIPPFDREPLESPQP